MSFVYDNRQKNEPGERRNDVSLKIHHSCIFSPSFSFRFVRILWPRSRSSNKTFCFRLTFYIMRILGRGKRCRSTPLKKYTHTHIRKSSALFSSQQQHKSNIPVHERTVKLRKRTRICGSEGRFRDLCEADVYEHNI